MGEWQEDEKVNEKFKHLHAKQQKAISHKLFTFSWTEKYISKALSSPNEQQM